MKFICLLLIVSCLFSKTEAQKDSLNQRFVEDKWGRFVIALPRKYDLPVAELKVSGFEVVDFRPDTSRLGFWADGGYRKQFLFKTTTSKAISTFLNNVYADPGNARSILIIIKKLWLYDSIFMKMPLAPKGQATKGRIEFRLEAFLKTKDGFLPFTYLDTIVKSPASVIAVADIKMPILLLRLMDKIATTDVVAVISRKNYFLFHQLDSLNKMKYAYPMDTATVFKKGVYASVSEFRNNQPSILDYEIQKDNNSNLLLYLKDETGKSYFSRKMWGYCDGQNRFAMMDGNLFPVLTIHHSFYIWGSKEYRVTGKSIPIIMPIVPGVGIIGLEPVTQSAKRRLNLFNLDVYSGEIY